MRPRYFHSLQNTNASSGFIQRVIYLTRYNWIILSQKPRKERPRRNLLTPAKSINTSNSKRILSKLPLSTQQSISLPTEYHFPAWSLEYFSPRRIFHLPSLFRNGVIFSYRYSCSYPPQRKQNLFFNISPGYDFPAPVKNLFS